MQRCSMRKQRFLRTTITIPPSLKKQMDAVKEDVNWSAVACRAFEVKLGEIATRKVEKNMETVIQRLRSSKFKHEDKTYNDGKKSGRSWATYQAEYAHLRELQKLRDNAGRALIGLKNETRPDWETWFDPRSGEKLAEVLLEAEPGYSSSSDLRAFWFGAVGEE